MSRKTLGNTTVRVLNAVESGTRYGFDIMDETGLPSGTVYPALSRLERMGYLRTRWEDQRTAQKEKRPPRKYYATTSSGRRALAEAVELIRELGQMLPSGTQALRERRGQ